MVEYVNTELPGSSDPPPAFFFPASSPSRETQHLCPKKPDWPG